MDLVAQSVRASDCGSEGRGFDPHPCPFHKKRDVVQMTSRFLFYKFIFALQFPFPSNNLSNPKSQFL